MPVTSVGKTACLNEKVVYGEGTSGTGVRGMSYKEYTLMQSFCIKCVCSDIEESPGMKLTENSTAATNCLDGNSEDLYCTEKSVALHVLAHYPLSKSLPTKSTAFPSHVSRKSNPANMK